MDFVIPTGISDLGLGGLVALGLLLIGLGRLIPRSVHVDRISDLKEQIAEKNEQLGFLQAALEKRDEQIDQLISNGAVAATALEGIRREAARA